MATSHEATLQAQACHLQQTSKHQEHCQEHQEHSEFSKSIQAEAIPGFQSGTKLVELLNVSVPKSRAVSTGVSMVFIHLVEWGGCHVASVGFRRMPMGE